MAKIAVILAAAAVAVPLATAARGQAAQTAVATGASGGAITLRARLGRGPWQRSLSIRLVKTSLIEFSLCALWDGLASRNFHCAPAPKAHLPAGTSLRLEQSPIGRALERRDRPGWGLLATSDEGSLQAVLSNTVSGDRLGTVRYRVTLRDRPGRILARSNVFTVQWHA